MEGHISRTSFKNLLESVIAVDIIYEKALNIKKKLSKKFKFYFFVFCNI